jgi:predicted AAA+ superfamily ATPase
MGIPIDDGELRREALMWALYSGRRSGRSARQFVTDLDGRLRIRSCQEETLSSPEGEGTAKS